MNNGKGRILVADGERVYVKALRDLLALCNYEVLTAQNGQTAIELAASREPDLILLSVEMPGMDGYEACRRIREFSAVPIFMLSTLVRKINIVKGLGAGANDCIAKLSSIEEFLTKIQAVIHPVG